MLLFNLKRSFASLYKSLILYLLRVILFIIIIFNIYEVILKVIN